MNTTLSDSFRKIKNTMIAIVAVLALVVLIFATLSHNIVIKERPDGDYSVAENVEFKKIDNDNLKQSECSFFLEEISHAETMSFFIAHHDIQVYIDNQCVYNCVAAEDNFITSGGAWVIVPIYEKDASKQVRIVLTQLYDDYETEAPEILVGSEIAIHNVTLHRALPALILCLYVIFAGFLILILAVYHSFKGLRVDRLYAIGIMAISAGLWRISYDRVASLLFDDYSVLIYYISLLSLMSMALSMLNSIELNKKNTVIIRVLSCVYCAFYGIQLTMQAFGVADLRQTLKIIHATIIVSAVAFIVESLKRLFNFIRKKERNISASWILSVGVAADLLIYYFGENSFNMIITLIAVLLYTVHEDVVFLLQYVKQKNDLKEMETQLTLSRTTTMMSQIRSHFVFNILNAISGMCKYAPEKADDTIVRFSRYLRNNIDIMEKEGNIPFETDLHQLEDYVALEQVRFGDKIEFFTDVETVDFMIPPLILQPVVENAIKHGISKKQGDGIIILRTRDKAENIVITVEDDGIGFDMTELNKEHSVGIRNIRFRLQHLVNGTLDIKSQIDKGTIVTITIPKEK